MKFASIYACDDCVCGLTNGCNRISGGSEPEALSAALALDPALLVSLALTSGQTHQSTPFRRPHEVV